MHTLRLYWTFYKVALKSRAEYRVDFAAGVFTAVLMQLAALSFYWVVFSRTPSIGGWAPAHVLFLFGVTAMALGLSELTSDGIWWLPGHIASGELDRLLVYPVHSLPFLLLSRPELHALGNLCSGAAMLVVSFQLAPPPWLAYLFTPLWVVCGALIYVSLLVIVGSTSFKAVGPWGQQYMIVHHLLNAARYPVHIYPRWLGLIILYVCPIGCATFIPGQWLESQVSAGQAVLAPLLAAAFSVSIATLSWQRAVRGYESTGS
jgi:ABC-2 type transport system permease protein